MAVTKNGICYDLENSPYFCQVGSWKMYFSSPAHLLKFKNGLEAHTDWLNDSMQRRFKFCMDLALVSAFTLYRKVETRGFLITEELTGVEYKCPESIEFRGIVTS